MRLAHEALTEQRDAEFWIHSDGQGQGQVTRKPCSSSRRTGIELFDPEPEPWNRTTAPCSGAPPCPTRASCPA